MTTQTMCLALLFLDGLLFVVNTMIYLSAPNSIVLTEGETVRFECVYSGPETVIWIINGIDYSHIALEGLPKHSVLGNTLIVTNVELSMNGSTYQCVAQSMFSNITHLYVSAAFTTIFMKVQISVTIVMSSNDGTLVVSSSSTRHFFFSSLNPTRMVAGTQVSSISVDKNMYQACPKQEDSTCSCNFQILSTAVSCFVFGCLLSISVLLGIICILKRKKAAKIIGQITQHDQEVSTTRNEAYEIVLKHHEETSIPPPIYESVDQNIQT